MRITFLTSKALRLENAGLREKIADLVGQLERARASRLISPNEEQAIAELRKQHAEMSAEQNAIGLFLRKNFAAEIDRGEHMGIGLGELVCKYLAKVKHGGKK